jgi:hypothetical protein
MTGFRISELENQELKDKIAPEASNNRNLGKQRLGTGQHDCPRLDLVEKWLPNTNSRKQRLGTGQHDCPRLDLVEKWLPNTNPEPYILISGNKEVAEVRKPRKCRLRRD